MQRVWLQVALAGGAGLGALTVCCGAFVAIGLLVVASVDFGWIGSSLNPAFFWLGVVAGSGPYPLTIAALNQATWIPPVGLLGIYLILLFPDGRLPSRRWRPLAWLSGVVMVLASLGVTFSPGPLEGHPGVRNPFGLEGIPSWVFTAGIFILLLMPLCMLASASSLVMRYRRSGGEQREQIKWIAFAASVVGLLYLITMVSSLTFSGPWGASGTPLWLGLLQQASLASFAAVPISVGFAVLKYRLYDIDLLINRALVYGPLSAMLALIYVGGVVSMQAVFRALTGQESTLAVVASTLAIAALFNPLRRRVQALVDRRFYRRKYDAAKTLASFNSRLREETDLDSLRDEVLGVVRETMQPAHASLWLRSHMAGAKEDMPG